MQVIVKKFSLMYNGEQFVAGQVADLPDDVATSLVDNAPREFALVKAEQQPAKKSRTVKKASKDDILPDIDASSLVK
jgi:hypothetical protein